MDQNNLYEKCISFYRDKKCLLCNNDLVKNTYASEIYCEKHSKNSAFTYHFYINFFNEFFTFDMELFDKYVDIRCHGKDFIKIKFVTHNMQSVRESYNTLLDINIDYLPNLIFDNINDCNKYFNKLYDNLLLV